MSAKFSRSGENAVKIETAFLRFRMQSYQRILSVFKGLMQDAMEFALKEHDERHQHHVEMGDGYGWALWYKGNLVAYDILSGTSEIEGDAFDKLMSIKPPQKVWYGVLLAYMRPSHYFSVDYENDILNYTAGMTELEFRKYFKPA